MEHHHPKQAHEIIQAEPNTLLIDVRTEVEFFYVGHPTDAINIEWNTAPDFDVNPHFAEEVWEMLGEKGLVARAEWPAHDPALALFNRLLSPMSACFRAALRFKQSTILGASV